MSNRWSSKRKRNISLIVFFTIVFILAVPIYLYFFNEDPTCFDGKLNGDERGIDCGGSCELLCSAQSLPLVQEGDARVLTIAPNVYEVVAVFKNPNSQGEVKRARYTIRLFEQDKLVPLKEIEGEVYIPKSSRFAIFEGPFALEVYEPTRAVFEWHKDTLVWEKVEEQAPNIQISEEVVTGASTTPRLTARVRNATLNRVDNIELIALILNSEGNIFASSKTFVDSLNSGESAPIVFAWPRSFSEEPVKVEILSKILPDRSYLR